MKKNLLSIIIAILVIILGIGGYYFLNFKKNSQPKSDVPIQENTGAKRNVSTKDDIDVRWEMTADGSYQPSATPPDCSSPLVLESPTDLSKVISILYPGQSRGGNYKPHGGFRFTDGANEIEVTAPMDATVVDGGRYLVDGEVQYVFDFVNSCGIKYRLGHLRTLAPVFADLAEKLPAAQEMDSRTSQIEKQVKVKAGDTIATAVGLISTGNAFFDFGVYDLRQENEASKNPTFQAVHDDDRDQAWHAVCWFDLLSAENETKVRSLPATSPGSESDYCK